MLKLFHLFRFEEGFCSYLDHHPLDVASEQSYLLQRNPQVGPSASIHDPHYPCEREDNSCQYQAFLFPDCSYSLVQDEEKSEVFVIATTTLERLSELLGKKLEPLHEFEGNFRRNSGQFKSKVHRTYHNVIMYFCRHTGRLLEGSTYEHPLLPGSEYRLLPAAHVSTEKGSGLVHTAPAHGREDFQVATKFGLPVVSLVTLIFSGS